MSAGRVRSSFPGRIAAVGGLAGCFVVLFFAMAGPARAAIVSGSSLAAEPNNSACVAPMGSTASCTETVSTLPVGSRAPGGTLAAIDGVIVSWRVRSLATSGLLKIRLRVVRGTTGAGSGPVEMLPAPAGIHSFAARVPVRAGDQIGLDMLEIPGIFGVPVIRGTSGATFDLWVPPLGDGEDRAPSVDEAPNLELLINATIESDADGDGFGDETQDACPSVANAGAACPPPPPQSPPNVIVDPKTTRAKITSGPKGKIDVRRAVFRFEAGGDGATFECKLDKRPYKPCTSPRRYRNLADGKHVFRVRSVREIRNDPTPAKRVFRVDTSD